jgi:hypothetical protein
MKTILSRWINRFFNLFTPDFNIRSMHFNEKEIARQLHYYWED